MEAIRLRIQPRAPVALNIPDVSEPLGLSIGEGHSADWYAGPYEITPKRLDQYLNTKSKTMKEDVTVKEIPYFETANEYGTTFVIGE